MDKFDESIKNAKATYEPSSNFVERTMQKITGRQPKNRWSLKLWAPVAAGGLAVIAILIALPLGSHTTTSGNTANSSTASQGQSASSTQSTQSAASASGSTAAGTDNASLTNDLNSINSSMSQESKDQGASNTAINDQSQEVTVPTS